MNKYIAGRMEIFKSMYNSKTRDEQIKMIRAYNGKVVTDILGIKSKREYCEWHAKVLIEEGNIKVGNFTFEELVDALEEFFIKRKTRAYSQNQRNILAYSIRKSRK